MRGVDAARRTWQWSHPSFPGGAWEGDSQQALPAFLSVDAQEARSSGKQQVRPPVKPLSRKLQRAVNADDPPPGEGVEIIENSAYSSDSIFGRDNPEIRACLISLPGP